MYIYIYIYIYTLVYIHIRSHEEKQSPSTISAETIIKSISKSYSKHYFMKREIKEANYDSLKSTNLNQQSSEPIRNQ